MLPSIVKWISLAALLTPAMSWPSAANYALPLDFVVCLGAIVVVQQALRAKEYFWAAGFVLIALLFNPVVPVPGTVGHLSFLMVVACMAAFGLSIAALKTRPLLSIPSITGNPGREPL